MADNVLITPASRKIDFYDASNNVDATIELNSSGDLVITNPGGDISLGDTTADVYIGDGTNNIDIVFEQNGEIRGLTGVTLTLGQTDSTVAVNALSFVINSNTTIRDPNNTDNYMLMYIESGTTNIADSFADTTTAKKYIYFSNPDGSNDPGYIMHETSDSETNEGVLHLVPTDDNGEGDYVSIHGTNDPDVIKLHTSGLIETAGYRLELKSGSSSVYINDSVEITGALTANGGNGTAGQVLKTSGSGIYWSTISTPSNTSLSSASWADANNTLTFTRADATTTDVQISFSEYVNPANTSTSSATYTDANTTLTFTRANATTYDVDLSSVGGLPPSIDIQNTTGTATGSGSNAIAIGAGATANGVDAIGVGPGTRAFGNQSIAIGSGSMFLQRDDSTGQIAIGYDVATFDVSDRTDYAIAMGYAAYAQAQSAISIGTSTSAVGYNAISIGKSAYTSSNDSIAIGTSAKTQSGVNGGVAVGWFANAAASNGVAIGSYSKVTGTEGLAVGRGATAIQGVAIGDGSNTNNGTAVGQSANAYATGGVAVGIGARATGQMAVSVGDGAYTTSAFAVCLGNETDTLATYGVSIGANSRVQATANGAVALGWLANANIANTVTLGSPVHDVQINRAFYANGGVGTSGQILYSAGSAANAYWADAPSGGGGGGASVSVSTSPPGSPSAGDLWWDSDQGVLRIYYADPDSNQWVDAVPQGTGGGGGGGSLSSLSDVTITSLQNNDLLKYNSTAAEWQNTNLGISIAPTISIIGSTIYGSTGVLANVTNHATYDMPAYFAEVRYANGTVLIQNSSITKDTANGEIIFTAPSVANTYNLVTKTQDFGDLESEETVTSFTVTALPSARYYRLSGSGGSAHGMVTDWKLYTGGSRTGTKWPTSYMTSNTTPSPFVASGSGNYSGTNYEPWRSFDTSTGTGFWNLGLSSTYSNWYLTIDLGSNVSIVSAEVLFHPSYYGGTQTLTIEGSTTGNFSGEEFTLSSNTSSSGGPWYFN